MGRGSFSAVTAGRIFSAIALAVLVGCADGKSSPPGTATPRTNPQDPAGSQGSQGSQDKQEKKMTSTDPRDPKAWEQAAALAQQAAGAAVTKHSDRLPFLFTAGAKKVLVHKGAVVTGRGPAVAGAYLRDLGVIQGMGPQIDDILVALDALDALPNVDGVDKRAWVDKSVADLAPYIYTDGTTAQVVLHYFLGGKPVQTIDSDPTHKKQAGASAGAPLDQPRPPGAGPRATARMTLEIRAAGDAAWKRETINT